ncbi:MAG: metal-dependent transcriptional regulator [Pyrinomonadaceae bacterium]
MTTTENPVHGKIGQHITPIIEDYLKAIYTLEQREGQVRTVALAEILNVKPPTVTAMLKTLANFKFIKYEPYQAVELTEKGRLIALEIVRHHRLIELYLVEALGFSWDEVHEEAEVLEHFISEKLEAKIAEYLGNPTRDPHGDPIPALDGTLPDHSIISLAESREKKLHRITRVATQDSEKLRYLANLGVIPGGRVKILAKAPFDGPITVEIGKQTHALDNRLARIIIVE